MVRRTRRSPSRPSRRLASLALAGAAALASVPLHAAELGDPRVASHIGQPLVADIELTMLEDPGAPVQVRLASPEVYNGAGIAIPPALATLNLSVMRRDGRQFLHATTLRSVDAEHLHLYLELVDKGQRVVRLATLWLTPDPTPAPPPVRTPAPAPAPVAAALVPLAAVAAPVVAPAPPARPAAPPAVIPARPEPKRIALPAPAPRLALPGAHAPAHPPSCQRQSDDAKACSALGEKNADLRAQLAKLEDKVKGLQAALGARQGEAAHAAPAPAPSAPSAKSEAPHGGGKPAAPVPAKEAAGGTDAHAAPEPARAGAEPAEKPPASKAQADAEAPKPDIKPDIKPAGPKPIHAIKPLVPRKPKDKEKEAQEEGGLPWGWIGGALALLGLGAGGVVLARRKKPANVDIPAPGLLDRLRQRFAARTRPASAPPAAPVREAEPSLE